jgi:predicted esterase
MAKRAAMGAFCALALQISGAPARADDSNKSPPAWCAPELETLADDVCYFDPPPSSAPRTLVIFLHGLIKPDSTWQWSQQRGIVRGAKTHGFSVLMPRGRRGVGPGGMQSVAWPLSAAAQQSVEQSLLDEWMRARRTVEARRGKPFDRVIVLGFSNGAYYASSLALRERMNIDGYGLFAGGSTTAEIRKAGQNAKRRVPIFVGIAMDDATSRHDSQSFAALLATLKWPHKVHASSVGHGVAERQLERALAYFRDAPRPETSP